MFKNGKSVNVFVRKRQADDLRRSIGVLLQLRLQAN